MIRFFRTTRKQLIDLGKLKRYLVYAIGEVLLIMIGIILALQFNNWNTKRLAKINEKIIFENIIDDLTTDYIISQNLLQKAKLKQEIHNELYTKSILENDKTDKSQISSDVVQTTLLISKTWDNHKNAIDKISNREVREGLNEYFRNLQTLQDFVSILNKTILDEFRPYIRQKELVNYKTVFESNPNQDTIDTYAFFNNDRLYEEFGSKDFNTLILELFLGTQDVIQWLETLSSNNKTLQTTLKTASLVN